MSLILLTTSGCTDTDDRAATAVAERFYAAIGSGDGAAACDLLAPRTRSELEQSAGRPCEDAILQEDVPRVSGSSRTQVFGKMGQVAFTDDTAFLAEFAGGWKVMAASCTPVTGHPYDCAVSG